jgi:hypothetical protein
MFNTEFNAWLHGFLLLSARRVLAPQHRRVIEAHIKLTQSVENNRLTIVNAWIAENISDAFFADQAQYQQLKALVQRDFELKPIISGTELAFFLQGYFEIEGASPARLDEDNSMPLNREQAQLIIRQIERNVDGLDDVVHNLYSDLRGLMSSTNAHLDTTELRKELNDLFEHVVDPSYGFDKAKNEQLQAIHDEYKSGAS